MSITSPLLPLHTKSSLLTARTATALPHLASASRTQQLRTPLTHIPRSQVSLHRKMITTTVPKTMRAILVPKTGGPEVLTYTDTQPTPTPLDNEVLVKNEYAGVNFIDTYFRTGLYKAPTGLPMIIGQEGVGKVVAVGGGDVEGLKVGDEVVWLKSGAYAEYTAVPATRALKFPPGIPPQTALGAFIMGLTSLALVNESHHIKKGDKVLLHAAAGGVGLLMCQLLKSFGAITIGTASTDEKCALAKANGADFMINYTKDKEWVKEVMRLTSGEGVDVVYDSVGRTTWEGSLEAVKRKGEVIFFGNASGPVPPIDLPLLAAKNTKIMRAALFQYITTREEFAFYSNWLFDLLKEGKLNVKIHGVYPLEEAQRVHRELEGRGTTGKLLLKL
ncbi:putative quinone oxidoreductase [Fimicolochytrium jonesii]|uniref:putative quinone oxidoreductase n=1 Tax=Fimicolochytrium jonesii TaxID=1396493 RepID=UPI0022FDC3C6|nr:putative quinone oxidoreductase [Fimicolochytrium jonesii]KAI8818882.1 putative quinone oxidoreductase [Fimicolochytrium jonesii]